jgi:hypothetical protein
MTPHVAQTPRETGRAIDARTMGHDRVRSQSNEAQADRRSFGWLKTIALMRKALHRGLKTAMWIFRFAAPAYNLVRM